MEDILRFVVTGCKLAQYLESNLGRLNGTGQLLEKCEQIAGAFTAASQGLRAIQCHVALQDQQQRNLLVPEEEEEELEMKIPVDEAAPGGPSVSVGVGPILSSIKGKEIVMQAQQLLCSASGGLFEEVGGELRLPVYEIKGGGPGGSSGEEGSSMKKPRKRKDETGKQTIEVAAPLHGNTAIPPDDGYTWRKYGQKEILGAQFSRGYYRCTHQKLYNCPAKKQVQRLNNNPRIFQVTYRGHHTCQLSSTAPASAIPPPPPLPPPFTTTASAAHHEMSLRGWLSIELTSQPLVTSTTTTFFDPGNNEGGTTSLNVVVGPGRDHQGDHGTTVVDMADAMFNSSAGSGDDGIDSIFSK